MSDEKGFEMWDKNVNETKEHGNLRTVIVPDKIYNTIH